MDPEKVGCRRWEEVGWEVGERVGDEGGRFGVGGGGGGAGGGGGGGGVLDNKGGLHSSLVGGGDEGSRGPPAPQDPVGIEEHGEGGLVLHGGGGGGGRGGVKGVTSH